MSYQNISINLNSDDVVLIEEDIMKVNQFKEMIIIHVGEGLGTSIDNIQEFMTKE